MDGRLQQELESLDVAEADRKLRVIVLRNAVQLLQIGAHDLCLLHPPVLPHDWVRINSNPRSTSLPSRSSSRAADLNNHAAATSEQLTSIRRRRAASAMAASGTMQGGYPLRLRRGHSREAGSDGAFRAVRGWQRHASIPRVGSRSTCSGLCASMLVGNPGCRSAAPDLSASEQTCPRCHEEDISGL